MFGRRKNKSHSTPDEVTAPETGTNGRVRLDAADPLWSTPGPREEHEVDHSVGYVDMGALLIPMIPGMQVSTQLADDKRTVIRVLLVLGSSAVQVSVAAAPRSGGVWEELRERIAEGMRADGAEVTGRSSRYGEELLARIPVEMPDGSKATTGMRVIGREGDRWFARIDVLGPAVQDAEEAGRMEAIIDRLVVVRDDKPRARLDLLPITMPDGLAEVPNV